jgi:hypothetical protein
MKFYNCYTINTGWTAGVSIVLMTIKTRGRNIDVAFWHFSDMPTQLRDVCFQGQSGPDGGAPRRPSLTHLSV